MSSALHEWDRIIWPKTTIDFLSQKIGSEIIAPTTPSTSTAILCKNQQKIWGLISVNDNFIQKLLPLQWWILHISHLNALFTRNNTLPTTTDENQEKKYIYTKDFLTFGVDLLRYYYYMKKTETKAFFKIKFKKHFLFFDASQKKILFLLKKHWKNLPW